MTGISGIEARLVEMFDSQAVFWLALLVALGVGAAHAVAPGHGKTITAAYLVGTRGRYRDALRLGVVVALMHTLSVLVLAITWVGLTSWSAAGTELVTAWMQVLAGLVVIGVGGHLAYRHLRHGPAPGHHRHDAVALTDPWSRRGLVAIALSGGLLPSPSAFLVLVTGLLTGAFGGRAVAGDRLRRRTGRHPHRRRRSHHPGLCLAGRPDSTLGTPGDHGGVDAGDRRSGRRHGRSVVRAQLTCLHHQLAS